MLICERCGKDCGAPLTGGHGLGLWRHGILSVCAECLAALGGPDFRGLNVGQVLARLERKRVRGGDKAPA